MMFTSLHTSAPMAGRVRKMAMPGRLLARLIDSHAAWKQRQQLLNLDANLLDDIGLTRHQALTEAARPLWDAPANWRS